MEGKIASMSIKEPFKATSTFVSIDEIEPIIRNVRTFANRDFSQAIELDHLLMAVCTHETCLAHKLLRHGLAIKPSNLFNRLELQRKKDSNRQDAIFFAAFCVLYTLDWLTAYYGLAV